MKTTKRTKINKTKQKIIGQWIRKHGAATFDLRDKNIILYDGGLFSIEKEIKIKPKTRVIFSKPKETSINGKMIKACEVKFIPIKRNGRTIKEKVEYYKANIWIEELDDIINYFKSMKKMLNKIGFKTNYQKVVRKK